MRKMFFFLLLTFHFTACDLSQAPDAVQQAFAQKYPAAEKAAWGIDENGYWEGQFHLGGEKQRADFQADGTWVETERSISYKDLPQTVRDAIEREFSKKDIEEIEAVDNQLKGVFYDVEFKPKGEEKYDVEFREDGTVLEKKRR